MLILFIISIVQIVFESLPISSSGHVALVIDVYEKYFSTQLLEQTIDEINFEAWFHSIHAFTALILAVFFLPQWSFLLINITRTWRIVLKLILLALIADIITYVGYFFFHLYPVTVPLAIGFGITACVLASLYFIKPASCSRSFNMRDAVLLGIIQGITLLPGISRFAATFVAARWLGYSGERAFTLTWMIQWPLIAAASVIGFYQLGQAHLMSHYYSMPFLVMYVIASAVSYGALLGAYRLAITNRMWWFAYYMPIAAIIALCV